MTISNGKKKFKNLIMIAFVLLLIAYSMPLRLEDTLIFKSEGFEYRDVYITDWSAEIIEMRHITEREVLDKIRTSILNVKVQRWLFKSDTSNLNPYSNYRILCYGISNGKSDRTLIDIRGISNSIYITISNINGQEQTYRLIEPNDFRELHNIVY